MKKDFNVIVQKYGGSSVSEPKKIKDVALFIKSGLRDDRRICVIVSAMGHTTNELIALANQVCTAPPKRELDMLISCGERSSMALLAMALNDIGVKAISLTGSQSGIITDDNHNGAEIIAVKPSRVEEAFLTNHVVIIAGFQGVSQKKEITTLRRGGSDTTAVAMASALNAEVCEIYTDVAGVMDIDPRIAKNAHILPTIGYRQMESMALYGAKVLAHDAIKLAKELKVNVRVAKTGDMNSGTSITESNSRGEDKEDLAFTHLRAVVRFIVNDDDLSLLSSTYFLCGTQKGDGFVGYASNDISQELIKLPQGDLAPGLSLITIHVAKNQFIPRILVKSKTIINAKGFTIIDLIVGHNEIFLVVNDDDLAPILGMLHEGLRSSS